MEEYLSYIKSCNNEVTNPIRKDGLGEHVKCILFTIAFAEYNNFKFYYTPIEYLEHFDKTMIPEIENMLGFKKYYDTDNKNLQRKEKDDSGRIADFCYSNMHILNCDKIQEARNIFRTDKKYSDYFDDTYLNIAIHIRRSNSHDTSRGFNALLNYQLELYKDNFYVDIINFLLNQKYDKKVLIHIYTQDINQDMYKQFESVKFHIHEDLTITFPSMVFADILVTGASTLSYSAGLLRSNNTMYLPYYHAKMKEWIQIVK